MRHVTEVESNLKCGAKAALTMKTLIVGPNGAGKSAIINAIELALSGAASDVAGRVTVAQDALLRTLCPTTGLGRAHVSLDDGTTGEWLIGEGRATRSGAQACFPLREVYDNLLGTPATAQKWLLRLVGKSELPTIVESLTRQAREAKARAKTLREAATAQAQGLAPEPTENEVEASKLRGTAKELGEAEAALKLAEERLANADTRLAEIVAKRDAAPTGNPALVRNGESIVQIIDAQVEASATTKCGLCANPTTAEALLTRRAAVLSRIAESKRLADNHAALDTEVANAKHAQGVAASDARSALATVQALKSVEKNGAIPVEIIRLQERWAAVRKLAEQAERAEVEEATLVARADTEKANLDREAGAALTAFVTKVQSFLPAEDVFGLDLDPVRFGLKREGALHCALSGAEWARVTAALAAAAADPGAMNVVVPEERAFDPDTLTHVLRAFAKIPCQVVLASPIKPTVVPDEWSVVRVGGTGFLGWIEADDAVKEIEEALAETPESDKPLPGFVPLAEKIAEPADPHVGVAAALVETAKKKRGRPSKAEKAAREAAEKAAEPPAAAVLPGQTVIPGAARDNECPHGCGVVIIGACEHGYGPAGTGGTPAQEYDPTAFD